MKIIKVSYTTKAEYAEQNKANIGAVMNDLRNLNHGALNYNACVCADGKTFIHTAFFQSEEDNMLLLELPSFKHFQEQLKADGIEVPPKQEVLSLVGSTNDFFN